MLKDILSYGIGTLTAFAVLGLLAFVFVRDITQKKHSVLRNYPIVGRLRYFFEQLGEYFRQYFFAGDRDEMPFNRATRGWVYRLAKNEGGTARTRAACATRASSSASISAWCRRAASRSRSTCSIRTPSPRRR